MISAADRIKNEIMYKQSWAIVRDLYMRGEIDAVVAERLNKKNAEKTEIDIIPII